MRLRYGICKFCRRPNRSSKSDTFDYVFYRKHRYDRLEQELVEILGQHAIPIERVAKIAGDRWPEFQRNLLRFQERGSVYWQECQWLGRAHKEIRLATPYGKPAEWVQKGYCSERCRRLEIQWFIQQSLERTEQWRKLLEARKQLTEIRRFLRHPRGASPSQPQASQPRTTSR